MKYGTLLFLLCLCTSAFAQQEETIEFGVSITTSAQREAFYTLARRFEAAHPGTKINFKALTSEVYKAQFSTFLTEEERFDVLYWHSGQRLFDFVDDGLVEPINDVWQQNYLLQVFDPSVKKTLTRNNNIYGLPISYYQIGFYYSKALFNKHGFTEPQDWQAFLELCADIQALGIPPIFIGTASNWPATAWFDYLNLRINGLDFHLALTKGAIPFTDPRVKKVLETWLEPINKGYFINEHETMHWREGLPFLYRGLTGMTMIGNYVIQDIPGSITDDIGFFPFPILDNKKNNFEEAPLDILIIPSNAKNPDLAKQFLAFVSQANVQSELNSMLGVISPHRLAQTDTSELVKEAYQVLSDAAGISQFFDRDASKEFADAIMPVIDNFMLSRDIEKTLQKMESIRLELYPELRPEKAKSE